MLARFSPHLPDTMLKDMLRKVRQTEIPSLIKENRHLHRHLVESIPTEAVLNDGSIDGEPLT